MTTETIVLPPQAQHVETSVKRLPPDVLRWLLELKEQPQSDEVITGLRVNDHDFGFVIVTVPAWKTIERTLNAPHHERRAVEREARNAN